MSIMLEDRQLEMFPSMPLSERSRYLSDQIITYLGNKRALLGQIGKSVSRVKQQLGKEKLRFFDAFSGSGIVSRYFKAHASYIASNDLETYAAVIARCYLRNAGSVDMNILSDIVDVLNLAVDDAPLIRGFIEQLYSPKDDHHITDIDRVFYTPANARRIDNYRRMIDEYPVKYRDLLLGPLLSKASVHTNTAGIFKAFYRNKTTGIGQYGGTNQDALNRIKGQIRLEVPVLSRFDCNYEVFQGDANSIVEEVKNIDLAYFDPPYNQHAYGSNYFMLNLIANYEEPQEISKMSGIPANWNRSAYNVKADLLELLRDLLSKTDARFMLLSFSDDGSIGLDELRAMLEQIGVVEQSQFCYNTFRGSRNLGNRSIHVTEQLFLIEKN